MNNNIVIIVQARMSSTRLPNKVLRPFQDKRTILGILIQALQTLKLPLIIATSTSEADDAIAAFCTQKEVRCYRGDEKNVLNRFIEAANALNATHIVRICADNPLFLHQSVLPFIEHLKNTPTLDYISYRDSFGTPTIRTHWGLLGELVSLAALYKINELTQAAEYQEHVTNFIYTNPSTFSIKWLPAPSLLSNRNDVRFTIDDTDDFELIDELLSKLPSGWSLSGLLNLVDEEKNFLHRMKKNIEKYTK